MSASPASALMNHSRLVGEDERAALSGLHALDVDVSAGWSHHEHAEQDLLAMAQPPVALHAQLSTASGPGCRRQPTKPAGESPVTRAGGAPKCKKPKTWPIRRGPRPNPGAPSRTAPRPSLASEPAPQPPVPELRAATARELVYSRDGWQWDTEPRPASARTGSASVRLEPLHRMLEPEPEPEYEQQPSLRPTPPTVHARASAPSAAAKHLMLVGGAAPNAFPSALLPPPVALKMSQPGVDETPRSEDEVAAGHPRPQKTVQQYRQDPDHQQGKWLYRDLDSPSNGADPGSLETDRCDCSDSATASVNNKPPLKFVQESDVPLACAVASEAAERENIQRAAAQEDSKLELESPALAKLTKARKARLRLASEAMTEQLPTHASSATRETASQAVHDVPSDPRRTEARNPLPLPLLPVGSSSRKALRGDHETENGQWRVQLGQRWNQCVQPDALGRLQLSSTSPFAVLSGNQVVTIRNEQKLNSDSPPVGGISKSVSTRAITVNTQRVAPDARKPTGPMHALHPLQNTSNCTSEVKADVTHRDEHGQQIAAVHLQEEGISCQQTIPPAQPEKIQSARAVGRSQNHRSGCGGAGRRSGGVRHKVQPENIRHCVSPLVGW